MAVLEEKVEGNNFVLHLEPNKEHVIFMTEWQLDRQDDM